MREKMKIASCIALALALLLSAAACGQPQADSTEPEPAAPPEQSSGSASEEPPDSPRASTDVPEGVTKPDVLTYWVQMDSRIAKFGPSLSDSPTMKKMQEDLGVRIDYIHPPDGMQQEQFMVLISSNDMPDIIEYDWYNRYPGGPSRAISDGVIHDLTPFFTQEISPNMLGVLEKYEEEFDLSRSIKTSDGKYYVYPCVRGEGLIKQVATGFYLREDWLNELGLDVPVTIDDWYNVLVAFRDKKGCEAPLTTSLAFLLDGMGIAGAYDVAHDFYVDTNGVIQFGPVQPEYREFFAVMAQWYDEKLIDQDFATVKNDDIIQKMLAGESGASIGQIDTPMGQIQAAMNGIDPTWKLVAAPHPRRNAGDPPVRQFKRDWFYSTSNCAAITTSCDNPAGATWVLDYNYSEEGYMYGNFGIEGESYYIGDDDKVYYTDLITDNPDGHTLKEMIIYYCRASNNAPFVRDFRVVELQRFDQNVIDAYDIWADVQDRSAIVPRFAFTEEENTRISKLMVDITSYKDEMFLRFIMGRDPLTQFDQYIQTIQDMNIEEVLHIYNGAYQRYKEIN